MIFYTGLISFFITHKYILLFIIAFACFLIMTNIKSKKTSFPVHINFLMLLLFEIAYTIFSLLNDCFYIMILIYPLLMYFIGVCLYNNKPSEKRILYISNSIIIGLLLHAILNYFLNVNNNNRNVIDIFMKINLNATLQATFVIMFLSTFFVNLQNKSFVIKAIIIIMCVLSVLFILLIGSRTSVIIFVITSVYTLLSIILYKDKTFEERMKKIKILALVIVGIICILTLYEKNIFNIKYKIETSHLYYRVTEEQLERADKVRYDNQFRGVVSLFKNPLGTKEKIGGTNYVHNMWLDIGKDAGIVCFVFLVLYSIGTLKTLILINKYSKAGKLFKIFLNSLYLGTFLSFQIEPILQAIPLYFGFFTLINGMLDMYYILECKGRRHYNEDIVGGEYYVPISKSTNWKKS